MKLITKFLLVLVSFFQPTIHAMEMHSKKSDSMIGIIIPMKEESKFFQKNMSHQKSVTIDKVKYNLGKIADHDIVFVNSGIGKVNSSIIITRLIKDFNPKLIILSGSAGGLNRALKEGDVVIGKNVIDADFGKLTSQGVQFQYPQYLMNPQTNSELPLAFNLDNKLINMISRLDKKNLPKIIFGKIATSDALPNQQSQQKLLQEGKFDIVDMESSSVLQTCWMLKKQCIVVRAVSNNVEDVITQQDIENAANNAAKVAIQIVKYSSYLLRVLP